MEKKIYHGPLIGLCVLILSFALLSPYFLTPRNLLNVLDQVTVLGLLAIGMTLVIITGGIDLSVGSVLAFSMMVMGFMERYWHVPLPLAIGIALLTGAACGAVSGMLVSYARIPPFIATLALMSIGRGFANMLTNGRQVVGYPDSFTNFATVRNFGIFSGTVIVFIVMCIVVGVFLYFRKEGRSLYAIGGNAEVAHFSGIDVQKTIVCVYVFSGVMSSIAAIVLAARLNSSQPSAGLGYELDTIATVVIGGTSLSGGRGSLTGTIIGVFIIGILRNGLNLMGTSPFLQQVIIGLVIAVAVVFDSVKKKT